MISAVDTNILLDIARPDPDYLENALQLLETAGGEGPLVICPVVHAELAAHFSNRQMLDRFLKNLQITADPLDEEATWKAGRAWIRYRKAGGKRERIISDFLIGAHAQIQTGRLLTRDRGFYRKYFSGLKVIESPKDF